MAEIKQNILEFVSELFPKKNVTIGNGKVSVQAMSFGTLASVIRQLKELIEILSAEGITWENYEQKENLFVIAINIIEKFPSLLSEASNIEEDSLKALPLDVIIQIISAVIEINMEAKDTFLKNFNSLVENLNGMMGTLVPKKVPVTKK